VWTAVVAAAGRVGIQVVVRRFLPDRLAARKTELLPTRREPL